MSTWQSGSECRRWRRLPSRRRAAPGKPGCRPLRAPGWPIRGRPSSQGNLTGWTTRLTGGGLPHTPQDGGAEPTEVATDEEMDAANLDDSMEDVAPELDWLIAELDTPL